MITSLTYHILMALADEARHGYGIIKEIEARLGASATPSTAALYLALQRMEEDELVEEAPAYAGADPRRRYYRLTRAGRSLAVKESARLVELVKIARRKKLLPRGAGA